ncbi:PLEIOTROPIC DRUG RESISTANCE PROTEIN 1-LIKE ISOFORM X1 [Salix koriyanagi]|uniref:PLEIOTROPIC DRUG RESISTANCE PROTEIN 1-LIKE ISOFORM X1 n=1 Tax=Salix koriyanagi TaxID=2511006 RepID=A0A9Q0WU36_9ROSI|nr:PLEIOTROPIC DRUG RESISTANCE PROTEIN 1-LIKE ISOFORM X1 [Salix koriyanagi]KAJ6773109.1 PLEIOTROPIC DRUG RESISTANCE PROTEIN 1-LIKE ISOFORM X1 [Salix koriyanagi]KAJ6773110.1 PLEIOTROPIC DRUG RESISTANCE PROTEIN 1-LIKE ISOFORM X1 [Salix koriyanagi]
MRSLGTRSPSMRSLSSAGKRNWASTSIREVWVNQGDAIQKSGREEEEEELRWATIERLSTYDRLRKGMLKQVLDSGSIRYEEVDVANLVVQCKKQLIGSILKVADEDNEIFLRRVRGKD